MDLSNKSVKVIRRLGTAFNEQTDSETGHKLINKTDATCVNYNNLHVMNVFKINDNEVMSHSGKSVSMQKLKQNCSN